MASQATLARIGIGNILLATDFSPESQNALQCALALARRYAAKLFLTHVIPAEVSTAAGDTWPPLMDIPRRNAEASMAQLERRET